MRVARSVRSLFYPKLKDPGGNTAQMGGRSGGHGVLHLFPFRSTALHSRRSRIQFTAFYEGVAGDTVIKTFSSVKGKYGSSNEGPIVLGFFFHRIIKTHFPKCASATVNNS